MSKHPRSRQPRPSARAGKPAPSFTPVPVRARHDGWTPARQTAFLDALSETACVEAAAAAAGMSTRSAYTLKARADAVSFRIAWEAALDFAVGRLGDALVSRALHGEVIPHFYRGEQVGEHRRHDNRLARWILQIRQPDRYGKAREQLLATRDDPDGAAALMRHAIDRASDDAYAAAVGAPRSPLGPLRTSIWVSGPPADGEPAAPPHAARTS